MSVYISVELQNKIRNHFADFCAYCRTAEALTVTTFEFEPNTQNEVKLFNPQEQLWTDHFAWSEDAIKIVGLTTIGRATISTLKMNRLQLTRVRKMWVKMGEHPPNI